MKILKILSRSFELSAALASALVMLMATPAFAQGETKESASAEGNAEAGESADEAAAREAAVEAEAEAKLRRSIRIMQQRPFLKDMRFEIDLMGGVGTADTMFDHYLAVANARFHIGEEFSIGASYGYYFSDESALFDEVTSSYELFPERSIINYYAGLDVAYDLLYGKLLLFDDAIVHFDIYFMVGGGVTNTTRADDLKPTGMFGGGWRIILTRWLTMNFEVRDHIFVESFNAGDEIVNNVIFQGGFGIFLPFDFDYRYKR